MAYLGRQPIIGNYQVLDAITASATATYALTKNSVAVFPQTPANCIVSLNGVIQAPTDSYTISGSNIVFASALTGSDSIDFITVLGDVLNVGTVSDGTIGLAKLSATGTKDATTFLRGDNTFQTIGTNTPAFEAHRSTDQTIADLVATKVQFATELFDTDSDYDNATNYRFTPQVAGKYFVYSQLTMSDTAGTFKLSQVNLDLRKNGSTLRINQMYFNALAVHYTASVYGSVDMNGSSDYLEIFVTTRHSTAGNSKVNGSSQASFFGAYKLIGV
jgi:hypothetical protein